MKLQGCQPREAREDRFWHEKMRFSQASQALFAAALRGDRVLAQEALRGLGDAKCCSGHGLRALQLAIACGHRDVVDVLLKGGAEINVFAKNTPPPMVLAAGIKDATLFEALLREGGDPTAADDVTGETALTRAADCGNDQVVGVLLGRGSRDFRRSLVQWARAGPQGDGATALHLAAARGFLDICRQLLDTLGDPNAQDRGGVTPLHAAARGDHVKTAGLLLTFGADASGCDRTAEAPLHLAAARGLLQMVELLLRQSADASAVRDGGEPPLYLAAVGGHGATCELLLRYGAALDAANAAGETSFMAALSRGHVQCCRVLTEAGAHFAAVDSPRWAPPFTDFAPHEHARMWRGNDPEDDDFSRLLGC